MPDRMMSTCDSLWLADPADAVVVALRLCPVQVILCLIDTSHRQVVVYRHQTGTTINRTWRPCSPAMSQIPPLLDTHYLWHQPSCQARGQAARTSSAKNFGSSVDWRHAGSGGARR